MENNQLPRAKQDYIFAIARMATYLGNSNQIRFQSIGRIDNHRVESAPIILSGEKYTFFVLRYQSSQPMMFGVLIRGTSLCQWAKDQDNIIYDIDFINHRLKEVGRPYLPDDYQSQAVSVSLESDLHLTAEEDIKGAIASGLVSSIGMTTGKLVKNSKNKKLAQDFFEAIFSDNFMTPEGVSKIKSAKGFFTTKDSILNHANITARQEGKPGVIVQNATWKESDGVSKLEVVFKRMTHDIYENRKITYFEVNAPYQVVYAAEGDIVRVDGYEGKVIIVGRMRIQKRTFVRTSSTFLIFYTILSRPS